MLSTKTCLRTPRGALRVVVPNICAQHCIRGRGLTVQKVMPFVDGAYPYTSVTSIFKPVSPRGTRPRQHERAEWRSARKSCTTLIGGRGGNYILHRVVCHWGWSRVNERRRTQLCGAQGTKLKNPQHSFARRAVLTSFSESEALWIATRWFPLRIPAWFPKVPPA